MTPKRQRGQQFGRSRRATPALVAVAAALVFASPVFAQKAVLQVTKGPYYAGVPIDLHVIADDFEEEPQPEVRTAVPDGATLEFVQSRPQVSSMMQIVGGRITQSRTVRFVHVYRLVAPKPGRYELGPFEVAQGEKIATTSRIALNVAEVPRASGQRLRVSIPEHPVYVGQRVPVTVEWWTEAGLADKLYDERIRIPLFLDTERFQFLDAEREPTRIVVNVEVPGGVAEFPADVRQETEGGTKWIVRSFSRTLVPIATGDFDLGDSTLTCEQAVAFRRDLFGSRVPSRTRRVRVRGKPITLKVEAVPSAGRPASFAGAIGQGFSMEVVADRTVLQAGDPVKLTFTIRGDGSLDSAALPPLEAAGLSTEHFRLPSGETPGIVEEGGKRFDVNVRVLDPAVREIPPVEYSWFDPAQGRFETTTSRPIALSVREAAIVGAGDVVRAEPLPAGEPADREPESHGPRGTGDAGAPAFTLTGADLSIETDPERLRSSSGSPLGRPELFVAGYAGGLVALATGLLVRRRRRRDPVRTALRKDLGQLRRAVASAGTAGDAADALRRISARLGDRRGPDGLDDVLAALDEATYAPGGGRAVLPDDLRARSIAIADVALEDTR